MAADLDGALWEDALAGGGLAYIQRAAVERQVTQEEGGVGGGMDGGRVMGYNFPMSLAVQAAGMLLMSLHTGEGEIGEGGKGTVCPADAGFFCHRSKFPRRLEF